MKLKNIKIKRIDSTYEDAAVATTEDGVQIEIQGEWVCTSEDFDEHGNFIPNEDELGNFIRREPFYTPNVTTCMKFHNCIKNGYDKLYRECLSVPEDPDYSILTDECCYAVANAILDYCKDRKKGVVVTFGDYEEKREVVWDSDSEDAESREKLNLDKFNEEQRVSLVREDAKTDNGAVMAKSKSEENALQFN